MMIHTHANGAVWHYVCLIASRRQNSGYPAACATFWAEMDDGLYCDWCEEPASGPGRHGS